jgi:AcrR family transcriptional regulator
MEALLDTAAEIFAEAGYEAATMTAISERSGTSIGGLYRYFPDKAAVARALKQRYAQSMDHYWIALAQEAKDLTVGEFSDRLFQRMAEFITQHPAYVALHSAPLKFSRDASTRHTLRMHFAVAFRTIQPTLTEQRALLVANVVVQIVKGMMSLYVEASPKDRLAITSEFKRVLADYLGDILGPEKNRVPQRCRGRGEGKGSDLPMTPEPGLERPLTRG